MTDASRGSAKLRQAVAERAGYRCEYRRCPEDHSTTPFSVEHIQPRIKEGETEFGNLAFACQGCNNHKYDHTEAPDPLTGEIASLYRPQQDRWSDHFCWSLDLIQLVGRTPTGRATIAKLKLNRAGAVNLRRILLSHNLHPPDIGTDEIDS
jgi:hypothetical protein